ncbi:DUF2752 domain-containing protein [Phycicoccus sp. Root101]|uniref:DUF2752 domain-containing protein n=1 Tax=Phycicoccus sp. Root101 TaxID=1736421 RepID=UPI0007037791|nr:DUF2752 domain-containing protein [Phycicoccus sp. Root101]KQU68521.1 hypothetical protein ASC58_07270 [Phycicoccus sp. Root101]
MTVAASRLPEPLRAPLLVGAGGLLTAAALLARDPHTAGSWPVCPILALTGVPCPACGGLRATHDLLTGHVVAALSSNAYAVLTVLLAAGAYVAWLAAAARGRPLTWLRRSSWVGGLWAVGLLAFGLLRLLPALSVLRP